MLDRIEDAIEDIKNGKMVIVVDDEDRENEGDFVTAARNVTPEIINFMSIHGRGPYLRPAGEDRCTALNLQPMVSDNTSLHETAFTVSIDLLGNGLYNRYFCTRRGKNDTGIDKSGNKTGRFWQARAYFSAACKKGRCIKEIWTYRSYHRSCTRLAGFEPAGVLVEIIAEDGTMARLPKLMEIAEKLKLRIISIKDLIAYRL